MEGTTLYILWQGHVRNVLFHFCRLLAVNMNYLKLKTWLRLSLNSKNWGLYYWIHYIINKQQKQTQSASVLPIVPIKGALDNFSLIPRFFSKKVEIFIPLEVYTYVVTACSILLATSTQLQRYLDFSFSSHF